MFFHPLPFSVNEGTDNMKQKINEDTVKLLKEAEDLIIKYRKIAEDALNGWKDALYQQKIDLVTQLLFFIYGIFLGVIFGISIK